MLRKKMMKECSWLPPIQVKKIVMNILKFTNDRANKNTFQGKCIGVSRLSL